MLTISKLGKRFGLSRATILYYEREGLLEQAPESLNLDADEIKRIRGWSLEQ